MMKVYKKVKKSRGFLSRLVVPLTMLFMGVFVHDVGAQCIMTFPFGSATLNDASSPAVTISTCNWASEYATLTINDDGQYEFTSSISTDYLTVTDGSNTVIDHGVTPLTVSIPSTGTYRLHIAADASCNTATGCRVTTGEYVGPLGAGSVNVQIGFGNTVANNSLYFPIYRFSSTSGNNSNRSFAIFEEAELIAAGITPGSTIESIGFEKDDGGTLPGQDVEMKIYMRTGTTTAPLASTPWASTISGATLVYDDDIAFSATDDWVDFSFSTPFVYTGGTLEIATENFMDPPSPYSTDAFKWKYDNTFGTNHAIGRVGFGSFSTLDLIISTLYCWRPNTRFDIVAPTGTDLAMQEFVEPLAACPGSTDVIVAILNAGSEDVDTATIGWTLNGVAQTSVTWTGNIGTGDTAHVNLGSFTSAASTVYNIEAFIQNVGPGLDTNTSNDTIGLAYQAALDGNFTINPGAPASGTNFQTFEDAIDALNTFGVCGPVVMEAVADTFSEQVILGDIAGASSTNTITFRGAGAGNTVLAFTQNVSNDRYTFRLDGASFVTIDSMSVVAEDGGTYGWGIHLTNGAHDITVTNCSIVVPIGTSTFFNGIIASGSNTSYTLGAGGFSNLTFNNNVFIGGYNSVRLNGVAADKVENVEFNNNELHEIRWAGFYVTRGENLTIDGNHLEGQTGITTGGGIYLLNIDNYTVTNNRVFDQGQYSLYFSNCSGTAANPALVANNELSGIGNTGNFGSSIRFLGSSTHVDIIHNSCLVESGTGRVFQITVTTPNNLRLLNNTFVHTESNGYAMYINSGNVFSQINNNNYFSTGSNFVYYGGGDRADLAALQAQNNPTGNDANSVEADPLYIANDNLTPLSGALSGAGTAFAGVTTDITGATRATPPDIGAYEFVPVNADFALIAGELVNGECLSNNDTVSLQIVHTIGAAVNLAVDSIVATFEVTGPATSTGTVVFNTGILTEGDTATAFAAGVDLSIPGIYTLNAYIDTNAVNESPANDTLSPVNHEIRPIFSVSPTSVTINNNQDSVEVTARSPFMPGGDFFITEICHFRGSSTGAPSGGWPSYMIADDYIEISGVPNSDLGGITLEVWTTTTQNTNYTFPPGTMMSPDGTAIVATGQLGSSQPSPSDFYYHGNGAYTGFYGSATAIGYILKDAGGNIIDACAYSGSTPYTFPAAANVSTADWSGSVPSGSGTAGIRLEGAYTKDATNWLVSSSTNPQDPNDVNPSVTLPVPANVTGLEWTLDGVFVDTVPSVFVGPFATPGTYYATATFQTPCGPQTDSVEIIVDFPFCFDPDSLTVDPACEEAEVSWVSGPLTTTSTLEYGPVGFTPGSGTTVANATSPLTITGLSALTDYDVYITDSCAGWLAGTVPYDSTFSGTIESDYNLSPTTSSTSACAGTLSVNIPAGVAIDSVSVEYDFTAGGGAWMSEQRSYVECSSAGGVAEASIASGSGTTAGTMTYNRSGLTIANGVTGGGNVEFTLHAFRTWGGSGCNNVFNVIDPGTFKVTVFTADSVFTQIGESMAMTTFSTIEPPVAAGIDVNDNGMGNYDFTADTNSVGDITWVFGDGNTDVGDTVNHTYASPGTYTVLMIAENNCGSDTASMTINYVSVDNFGLSSVNMYPNPSRGDIIIDQLPVEGGKVMLMIHDVAGQNVFAKECALGTQRLELNLEHLSAGTYFITLSNDLGRITKSMVIVK